MLFSKIRLNLLHPRHLVDGEGTATVAVTALQAVGGGLFERQIVLLRQHVAQPGQIIIFVDEADIQPRRTGVAVLAVYARALRVPRREGGNDGIVPLLRFQVKQIAQNAVPLVILQITDFIQTVHEAKADVLHRVLSADGGSEADHADLLVPMGQLPVFHNIHLINLLYACQGV